MSRSVFQIYHFLEPFKRLPVEIFKGVECLSIEKVMLDKMDNPFNFSFSLGTEWSA